MEIERKWLFNSDVAPDDSGAILIEESDYTQGYLSVNPEVRIRSKHVHGTNGIDYKLCIKSKGNLERIEVEKWLTLEEYHQLMEVGGFDEEDRITKHIRVYKLGYHILAVGIVDKGRDTEFIYGEIEFDTVEEANAFDPPEWFGAEVTNEPSYKMCNYWARTRLKKKIYIAGKITGDEYYQEKFKDAAEKLNNYIILNPAALPADMETADYMRICFPMIDTADAVVFLPDYKESKGALLELSYCQYCNKEIIHINQMEVI